MNTESHNLPRAQRSRVQETIHTDSRDILAAAVRDQKQFGLKDYFIVDVHSHHVEGSRHGAVREVHRPVPRADHTDDTDRPSVNPAFLPRNVDR
jgi:hypothetical protein